MSIVIRDVFKTYGNFVALDKINLEVPDGTLLALLGPSGSGKTTLLRVIAGLEVADSGAVFHEAEEITNQSARDRKVGFVFQHYALFRHMTVAENIGYGLRVRKAPKEKIARRVDELLKLIRLDSLGSRYPGQLSGGQRQRVALARALAAEPKVLLLDEPFGALDAKVRTELRQWLRRLHEEIQVTSVFVTHDQEEAFEVADQVVVMNRGKIEQVGTPAEVFEHPANAFVMDFLGNVNVFDGAVAPLSAPPPVAVRETTQGGRIYVRPHEVVIRHQRNGSASIGAKVVHVNPAGSRIKIELRALDSEQLINAELTTERFDELNLKPGELVFVSASRVRTFAAPDYAI